MLFTRFFLVLCYWAGGVRNGGMPVRLSGLNLLNRFLLFIYAASLQSRRYARNYVAHNGCWPLMTAACRSS
jgi:hypothetical protein